MISELETDPKAALKGKAAAVVVFYADWCPDSKTSLEYEKKLSEEYAGRVEFFRFDAVNFEEIADSYNIEVYPTFIFFRKGKAQRGILADPYSEAEVRNWIEMKLGRSSTR